MSDDERATAGPRPMNRDRRLRGLSSEHHQALVIARTVARRVTGWSAADGEELARRFAAELEPHFRIEEEVLLPALRPTAAAGLADRTADDHAFLRRAVAAARAGAADAARDLAQRLAEHVRFEERELFPACEQLLPADVLDEVARRAPAPD